MLPHVQGKRHFAGGIASEAVLTAGLGRIRTIFNFKIQIQIGWIWRESEVGGDVCIGCSIIIGCSAVSKAANAY